MADQTYPVLSRLTHNGRDYGPGEEFATVEMNEREAGALIAIGVLGEALPSPPAPAPAGETKSKK